MSRKMPWTVAMEEVLADGEWHDKDAVIQAGMNAIPEERALEEMKSRALQASEESRIASGRRTLATQTLMSFSRFGTAKYSQDKSKVRKTSPKATNPGELVERVEKLEQFATGLLEILSGAGIDAASELSDLLPSNGGE